MRLRARPDDLGPAGSPNASPAGERQPIGQLLRESGALSEADVARVLERQAETGELFGEAAVALGLSDAAQVRVAVERQQSFFVLPEGTDAVDPLVVTAFDPNDPLAQEVRRLRGEIGRATGRDQRAIRSVVLLGFQADSERSLLAANLGVAFAQAGYRTLLVDAVLGAPQLSGLLRLPNRIGVSTFLSSEQDADQAIQPSAIPSLSLMSAGPPVPNDAELFDRQRLFRRLRGLGDAYDMVLVDVANEHALAAADGADGALLVVRRDASDLREVRRAAAALTRQGATVLGSVMMS